MQWERPVNDGLGLDDDLRCLGSRWGVRLTASVLDITNHAVTARDLGEPLRVIEPVLAVIGELTGHRAPRPFAEPLACVREMVLIRPLQREVFLRALRLRQPALRLHLPALAVPHQPAHPRRHHARHRRPQGAALLR